MAEYNAVFSSRDNVLMEGTDANDSISAYGNHSTIQAYGGDDLISVNGGRHDSGIWIGDEENFVYAGDGNDSITVLSRGAKVFGEDGNDTINFLAGHVSLDGGDGNDLFFADGYRASKDLDYITITGGKGNDTIEIKPYNFYSENRGRVVNVLVTDFSNDDSFRFDYNNYFLSNSAYKTLTQTVVGGNVVISDGAAIETDYSGNTLRSTVEPQFYVTLQGVSDISEIADAKYYRYEYYQNVPKEFSTFGELFGVSAVEEVTPTDTVEPETETSATNTSTVENNSTQTDTSTVINNYYGDVYNINDNNGTVVINSSVDGGVTNNTNIDNSKTIVISGNTYTYSGGDKVISNYQQGELIELASDYQGIDLIGNSFYVKSSSGSLEIQNSRDKFIGYTAANEPVAYTYVAGLGGAVDGRGKDRAEIMIGYESADYYIYAADAGSSMWGGNGGNDIMMGGAGYDEYFYAVGNGNDIVQNAYGYDVVNMSSVSLEQISYVNVNVGSVDINFNDGGSLRVQGDSSVGYRLNSATYAVNQYTGEWSVR